MKGQRFRPPREGMMPNERLVWAREKGSGFFVMFGAMFIAIGGPLALINLSLMGKTILLYTVLTLLSTTGVFLIYRYLDGKTTRYYLTNKRIVKTKLRKITREIPISKYWNAPLGDFVKTKVSYSSNNEPRYSLQILDPDSWEPIVDCNGVPADMLINIKKIGTTVRCSYCNTRSTVLGGRCEFCGGIL